MLRFMLLALVLIAAPFIVFALWRAVTNRPDAAMPAGKLLVIGTLLFVVAAIGFALIGIGRDSSEGTYTPPRMEDGRIVPGRMEPEDQRDTDEPAARMRS